MKQDIENGKVGASFKDFLEEQGAYEETSERAFKRVSAFQLLNEITDRGPRKGQAGATEKGR